MTSFHFLTGERKLRRKGEQTSNRSVSYTQHRLDTELLWPPALLAKQRPLLKRRSRKKKLKTFWASQKFLGPSENPATPQATGKTGYNLHIPVPLSYVNVRPYAMMVGRWLYSSHRSEPSLTGKGLRTQWWISEDRWGTSSQRMRAGQWGLNGRVLKSPHCSVQRMRGVSEWALVLRSSPTGKGWKGAVTDSPGSKLLFWPRRNRPPLIIRGMSIYQQRYLYLFKWWSMKPLWWNSCCFIERTHNSPDCQQRCPTRNLGWSGLQFWTCHFLTMSL